MSTQEQQFRIKAQRDALLEAFEKQAAPQQEVQEPVHDWKAEYIKLEKLYNEARMELYDEQILHRKTLYELEEALDKLAEMDVALERMRQKYAALRKDVPEISFLKDDSK